MKLFMLVMSYGRHEDQQTGRRCASTDCNIDAFIFIDVFILMYLGEGKRHVSWWFYGPLLWTAALAQDLMSAETMHQILLSNQCLVHSSAPPKGKWSGSVEDMRVVSLVSSSSSLSLSKTLLHNSPEGKNCNRNRMEVGDRCHLGELPL